MPEHEVPPASPGPDRFSQPNPVSTMDCELSDADQVSESVNLPLAEDVQNALCVTSLPRNAKEKKRGVRKKILKAFVCLDKFLAISTAKLQSTIQCTYCPCIKKCLTYIFEVCGLRYQSDLIPSVTLTGWTKFRIQLSANTATLFTLSNASWTKAFASAKVLPVSLQTFYLLLFCRCLALVEWNAARLLHTLNLPHANITFGFVLPLVVDISITFMTPSDVPEDVAARASIVAFVFEDWHEKWLVLYPV